MELPNQLAEIVLRNRADPRREEILQKLMEVDQKIREDDCDKYDPSNRRHRSLNIDTRLRLIDETLRPIEAFTPREMGEIISLMMQLSGKYSKSIVPTTYLMLSYLPGGPNFRPCQYMGFAQEIVLRFDVLPYCLEWEMPDALARKHDLVEPQVAYLFKWESVKKLGRRINAIGVTNVDNGGSMVNRLIFHFENEEDLVLAILAL